MQLSNLRGKKINEKWIEPQRQRQRENLESNKIEATHYKPSLNKIQFSSVTLALSFHSFWCYSSTDLQWHIGHLLTWGVNLSVSHLFAFSYCSWASQGKNTEVVCHSLLQWTTFCQNSPPWPIYFGWLHTAWLSFIELDKAVVRVIRLASFLWLWFQSVCPLMPSLSACHLTWVSLTLDVRCLFMAAPAKRSRCSLPWTWDISSWPLLLALDMGYLLSIRLTANFSLVGIEARRQWEKIFKVLKEKDCQPKILYPAKLFFKMKGRLGHSQIKSERISCQQACSTSNTKECPSDWIERTLHNNLHLHGKKIKCTSNGNFIG